MGITTYTGVNGGLWTSGGNWDHGVPDATHDPVFATTAPADPGSPTSVNSLEFQQDFPQDATVQFPSVTVTAGITVHSAVRGMTLQVADWAGVLSAAAPFTLTDGSGGNSVSIADPLYPPTEHVLLGTAYATGQAEGHGLTGELTLPAAANVRSGIQYGNPDAPIDGGATFTNAHGGMGLGF
jgi:hypothetical protein